MSEKTEKIIQIEGMSCQHCVMSVKKGLSSLDGVTEVDVNLEAKIARVKGQIDDDKIKATINELGYTVKGIE
jgi:copper ion binding protein